MTKRELRIYMVIGSSVAPRFSQLLSMTYLPAHTRPEQSSRPPPPSTEEATAAAAAAAASKSKRTSGAPSDEPGLEDAPTMLANDLALQRLLAESHLLSAANPALAGSSFSSSSAAAGDASIMLRPFAAGRTRQRATDLRVQALLGNGAAAAAPLSSSFASGHISSKSRSSIFAQARMPMAQRKGIAAAASAREARRRREAKENGIVLERAAAEGAGGGGSGGAVRKRKSRLERAEVGAPAVGRMKGAELRLSRRDVRAIEGPPRSATGKGAGGGHKKRRGKKR